MYQQLHPASFGYNDVLLSVTLVHLIVAEHKSSHGNKKQKCGDIL